MEMNAAGKSYLKVFMENLENGIDFILSIATRKSYAGENLATVVSFVLSQRERLHMISQRELLTEAALIAS
jgi:hypothetical protein